MDKKTIQRQDFYIHIPFLHHKYLDIKEITMYLLNILIDYTQTHIVRNDDFFDIHIIQQADKYFKYKANI